MRLFRPWFFSSLILGKWNVNGRRGKWLEAGVALFFLKLHARDQQTKWVRERFHNISDGFPYAPRWGTEIFHTQKNFDLPQFVRAKGWSIYIFIPSQNLGRWLLCSLSAPTFPNSPASPRSTHDASCPLLQTSQGAPSTALLPFPLKPSRLTQDTHFYGTPSSPAAHGGHMWAFPGDKALHITGLHKPQLRGNQAENQSRKHLWNISFLPVRGRPTSVNHKTYSRSGAVFWHTHAHLL